MSDTSANLPAGYVLGGRYEITAEIGRGGFGTVYRARQLQVDRDVAIKVLPPHLVALEEVAERFRREARVASRLHHPNIITLHDYGQQGNLLYMVMEYLQGEDLCDIIPREGRMATERLTHITRQILRSLAEAHQKGVVHRDLKPENIFLSQIGEDRDFVKVLDFGIAKLASAMQQQAGQRRLTAMGSTVGTPAYMSPEQASGEDVDHRSDLYALGVMMYEMACGRPPFHDPNPVKLMRQHLVDEVPPLTGSAIAGTMLESVIRRALHKDRNQRYQSAMAFLEAVQACGGSSNPEWAALEYPAKSPALWWGPPDESLDAIPFASSSGARRQPSPGSHAPGRALPAGFRREDAAASSIITVLEPHSDQEVIVLTTPKRPLAPPALPVPPVRPMAPRAGEASAPAIADAATTSTFHRISLPEGNTVITQAVAPAPNAPPARPRASVGSPRRMSTHEVFDTNPDESGLTEFFHQERRRNRLIALVLLTVVAATTVYYLATMA